MNLSIHSCSLSPFFPQISIVLQLIHGLVYSSRWKINIFVWHRMLRRGATECKFALFVNTAMCPTKAVIPKYSFYTIRILQVVPGLDEGVSQLSIGERAKVMIVKKSDPYIHRSYDRRS